MTKPAIQIESLSKQYHLGALRGTGGLKRLLRRGGGESRSFWALRDVTLDVEPGEVMGLVGHNGAGKSTLLKILSRITSPSHGRARIRGRIGSLLEVGTGFHPELSGRENIYLNGAILGMQRREIKSKFDKIVSFAEVDAFLDTPVKRYSSGMRVRLAFAVAAHLTPEVLLIDEVLAVGDASFQKKCLGKMDDVAKEGRTIVFVSHNMGAISRICQRAVWLDHGQVKQIGHAGDVVTAYMAAGSNQEAQVNFEPDTTKPGQITSLTILDPKGDPAARVIAGEPFTVRVDYALREPIAQHRVGILLRTPDGLNVYGTNSTDDAGQLWQGAVGSHTAEVSIPRGLLASGRYLVSAYLGQPPVRRLDQCENAISFVVDGSARAIADEKVTGVIGLPLPWQQRTAA